MGSREFLWVQVMGSQSIMGSDYGSNISAGGMTVSNQNYIVRWSNFEFRDPKVGLFFDRTQATPCGHYSKWKLAPENPHVDIMSMAAMVTVL